MCAQGNKLTHIHTECSMYKVSWYGKCLGDLWGLIQNPNAAYELSMYLNGILTLPMIMWLMCAKMWCFRHVPTFLNLRLCPTDISSYDHVKPMCNKVHYVPLNTHARCFIMTSSNGNNIRVTGHLCGEFTPRQWHGALMLSLICAWINGWVNNREAGDLRPYLAQYDVTVMSLLFH